MNWKPKLWIAVLLNVFTAPLAFLYVAKPGLALTFIVAGALLAALGFFGLAGDVGSTVVGLSQIALLIVGIILAYRAAKRYPERARPWYSRWYGLVGIGGAFALAIFTVRVFLYEPFKIPSTAMAPTAERGSVIIVQKYGYGHFSTYGVKLGSRPISAPLKRGDIVVFDFPVDPSQTYIKRVVGLPGDHIVYRDKHLIVNGRDSRIRQLGDYLYGDVPHYLQRFDDKLDDTEFNTLADKDKPQLAAEPSAYPFRDRCKYSQDEFSCDVPPGNYFVMGDNRDNTFDSRYWGFVRSELIIGKVVKIAH